MVAGFDLFKIDSVGRPLWLGPVESLEDARRKARAALETDPTCDFCVLNHRTGTRQTIPRSELVK